MAVTFLRSLFSLKRLKAILTKEEHSMLETCRTEQEYKESPDKDTNISLSPFIKCFPQTSSCKIATDVQMCLD